MRGLKRKKSKYTLYLGVDQMAMAAKLAERSGKSVSALVGEALHYLFKDLGLEVDPPELPSDHNMLKKKADEL